MVVILFLEALHQVAVVEPMAMALVGQADLVVVVVVATELVVVEQADRDTAVVLVQTLPTNGLTEEEAVVLQAVVQTAHTTQPQTAETELHQA